MKLRGMIPLAGLGLAALLAAGARLPAENRPAPRALPPQESLEKARVDGKYAMLLRQFKDESAYQRCGAFRDVGKKEPPPDDSGFPGDPGTPGFAVYVYPYWYVWRDETDKPQPKRAWGPEQATGEPDTPNAGDMQTAWASQTPDGQDEWLMLEYAEPVVPSAVLVHETYNPGALVRVTAFNLAGEEVELWKGKDPTAVGTDKGVSEVKCDADFKTNRVRIYLDSKAVPGWNEIDAVGLRDSGGKTHWATAAAASSTYAEQGAINAVGAPIIFLGPAPAPVPVPVIPPLPPAVIGPAAPGPLPIPPPAVAPNPPAAANPPPAATAPANPPAAANPAPAPGPANRPGPGSAVKRIKQLEEEVKELQERVKALEDQLKKER